MSSAHRRLFSRIVFDGGLRIDTDLQSKTIVLNLTRDTRQIV
jgi:hypothetical protein